jgi:uncharacterized protein YyaL (SSP411 family)
MQAVAVLLCCGLACEQSQPPVVPRAAAAEDETEAAGADGDVQQDEATQGKPREGKPREHKPNRLANETSLYLLMHAHNPVDWYPWGEEALEKAKKENKVIFLSIGYSSCHWCHVMERETFLDEEIAALMNKHFVCIKVDREERPDVDDIYMKSLQVYQQLTGSPRGGGWPLSMFLTPDGKPFFGGTYFPARDGDRGEGSTGFLTIINRVRQAWTEQPDGLKQNANTVAEVTKAELEGSHFGGAITIDAKLLDAAQAALAEEYDEKYGGFGFDPRVDQRPKFPEPSNLFFLVDRARKAKDTRAEEMLVHTLQRMAMGGIRDHLGGGFHRYSVDRMWQIPHFEKMLYDNGQLASVYTEAYLLTGREDFRRVVDEMLRFVLREMTSPDGAFYSALDAESEGEEGKFYVWKKAEVESLLTGDEFKLFAAVYGLDGEPNFGDPPTVKTHYAPQLARPLHEIAADRKMTEVELEQRLSPIRQKLFDARSQRERPLTDTKILTSWNGLMIRGFADAGRGLKNEEYVKAAERAADFVLQRLRTDDGRLLRTFGKGQAKLNAYLNDYAFLADGLIALFQATGEAKWLTAADELTAKQLELFWDETSGGFFFISDDHETLLARAKNPYDGAQPSGNSVAAQNLVFLGSELNKPEYLKKAERTIGSLGALLDRAPAIATRMMVAASMLLEVKGATAEGLDPCGDSF